MQDNYLLIFKISILINPVFCQTKTDIFMHYNREYITRSTKFNYARILVILRSSQFVIHIRVLRATGCFLRY